jgi:5-bromo-4-chloroindolyl phosphate hydrolysis protein
MIPRSSSTPTIPDLLAERRATINELRQSTCKQTRRMLAADIDRIDVDLAMLRSAAA